MSHPKRLTDEQVKEIKEQNANWSLGSGHIRNNVDRLLADREALLAERDNWIETARQHHKNEEYYRGLVVRVGEAIGPQAYVSDDGSAQKDVLCAKVPELVGAMLAENAKLRKVVEPLKRYRSSTGNAAQHARQEVCDALDALDAKDATEKEQGDAKD